MFQRLFTVLAAALLIFTQGYALSLRDNLDRAEAGDFIVAAYEKNYVIIHVVERHNNRLMLEEITVPANRVAVAPGVWQNWINDGAPGHSGWLVYDLECKTCTVSDVYDLPQRRWKPVEQADHLLGTLMQMEMRYIPEHKRKKIGPPPVAGELDRRRVWNPPIFFKGVRVHGETTAALQGHWPHDGSEMAGKKVVVYMPEDKRYLNYFPYWIELSGGMGKAKLRIKDSGRGLYTDTNRPPARG